MKPRTTVSEPSFCPFINIVVVIFLAGDRGKACQISRGRKGLGAVEERDARDILGEFLLNDLVRVNALIFDEGVVRQLDVRAGGFIAPTHGILAYPTILREGDLIAGIQGLATGISLTDPGERAQFKVAAGKTSGITEPPGSGGVQADDLNTAVSHLGFPDRGPGLAEGGGGGGELQSKCIAIGIGAEVRAFSQGPTGLFEKRLALFRIEGIDGDVFIAGISPVGLRDEGVHDQGLLRLFRDQRIDGFDQVEFVGAVSKSLANFKIAQNRVRRGV